MKTLLIFVAVALSSCAVLQQPPSSPVEINKLAKPDFNPSTQEPIDQACAGFAKVARAVAAVRDAGVPIADAPFMIGTVLDYPIGPVIREVYARTDVSPGNGATNSYQACRDRTFTGMIDALKGAESKYEQGERVRIQAEHAAKKKLTLPVTKKLATPVEKTSNKL